MFALLHLFFALVFDRFKTRRRLEFENLYLRYQLNIAMRRAPHRLRLRRTDRAFMVWMTRLWPGLLMLSRVVQPDTILRWHERVSGLLALEVSGPIGAPQDQRRTARTHSADEPREPALGCAPHPR